MNLPQNLKHKPIVSKEIVDDSDARFFSIGKPQWDNADKNFSIKVFRKKDGGRWSPQSEEIPLGRFLKMAEFLIGHIAKEDATDKKLNKKFRELWNSSAMENISKTLNGWAKKQEENR